ncbi:phytanoyl-CoA dioxygenase family protein [Photorhabdus laumondii]|uniref:Phytanoyl-CoA dioxygenase n=1 Tax=Photorhabdus laumondii subsp. clarkei TaxID=2029685 RepID=A0A329VEK7_9GAMM|nr:phytanoyl-CoA dioxygenase family protein [Photorhabdus laumondii]PQQ36111.1 hypothetical protein C6H68_21305 [Photorhabdus luminescens]RAW86108.1 hypothetical protein CKY01_18325 [Photorhabdus laumondii subsp. clarkei]
MTSFNDFKDSMNHELPYFDSIIQLERVGFTILCSVLSPTLIDQLLHELMILEADVTVHNKIENRNFKFSPTRFMIHDIHKENYATVNQLVNFGKARQFVAQAVGGNPVCLTATFANCKSGNPSLSLHTDYDPYNDNIYRPNYPSALRVIHYLDDLEINRAPLRLIPYSHNFLHRDFQHDFISHDKLDNEFIPEIRRGDVVVINPKVIHGTGANTSGKDRRIIATTYYPDWSKSLK